MSQQDLSIELFERLAYGRQHEAALRALLDLLAHFVLKGGVGSGDDADPVAEIRHNGHHATRLAAAVTALLTDPALKLSDDGYARLCLGLPTLHSAFRMSGFRHPDHLMPLVGSLQNGQITVTSRQQLMRLLLSYSVHGERNLDFRALFRAAPPLAVWTYFGMLAGKVFFTESAENRRQQLLAMRGELAAVQLEDGLMEQAVNAWMLCSYAEAADKHAIKADINALLRRWVLAKGVKEPKLPALRRRRERPVVLVALERFPSFHSMYRCYAASIRQLKQRFKVIGMAAADGLDDTSRALFDGVIEFGTWRPADIGKRVEEVARLQPDLIYYPSLGMNTWTVPLATLRLAPIQFATIGHPATTNSPCIDYMVFGREHVPAAEAFSEKLVILRSSGFQREAPVMASPPPPQIREHASPVRLAVVSRSMKLSARFLRLCRRVEARARRPVQFWFFPDERALLHQAVRAELQALFPTARCFPSAQYAEYLENLNQCDLRLGTFPFGGSNSSIDAARQGIPSVTLVGEEAHGRTDARNNRLLGLPDWLCCGTEAEYEAAVLRLVDSDEERVALSRSLLEQNPDARLFELEQNQYPDDFVETVGWIYDHHDRIQADGRRLWTYEERRAFAEADAQAG